MIAARSPIRLVIADDHLMVREGLRRLLGEMPDVQVVAEAENGAEVLALLSAHEPDVLLLDIGMPGQPFLETLSRTITGFPRTRVLVLSVHPEEQFAVRALRAGAAGYLTKNHSPEELGDAIRTIHRGARYVTSSMALQLALHVSGDPAGRPHESLSNREFDVLIRLGRGQAAKEIAASLNLSPKTVSTYRARVLEKMDLQGNADIVRYVVENGLSS